jgi:hypothetical protein
MSTNNSLPPNDHNDQGRASSLTPSEKALVAQRRAQKAGKGRAAPASEYDVEAEEERERELERERAAEELRRYQDELGRVEARRIYLQERLGGRAQTPEEFPVRSDSGTGDDEAYAADQPNTEDDSPVGTPIPERLAEEDRKRADALARKKEREAAEKKKRRPEGHVAGRRKAPAKQPEETQGRARQAGGESVCFG